MFRRTILPITSSEIIKTGLKGRIEAQTVNEEVNIFLEGQIDSGFISTRFDNFKFINHDQVKSLLVATFIKDFL